MAYGLNLSQLEATSGTLFKSVRIAYDTDSNPIYIGKNFFVNAPTSSSDWLVWTLTWSSGNLVSISGPTEKTWDGRAA